MRPDVTESTEVLYTALGPLTDGDEARDWPLLRYCDALCRAYVEQIWGYVSDTDDELGWVIAFDVYNAPAEALPYLAQFVGVVLGPGSTEADQRAAILDHAGFRRGTPEAMISAVARTLTGTQTVNLVERVGGNAYQLEVETLPGETPDAELTERAILSQKPIGIVFNALSSAGQTWADLAADHADWAAVDAEYPDWIDVVTDEP